jgi:hypothetical protein
MHTDCPLFGGSRSASCFWLAPDADDTLGFRVKILGISSTLLAAFSAKGEHLEFVLRQGRSVSRPYPGSEFCSASCVTGCICC